VKLVNNGEIVEATEKQKAQKVEVCWSFLYRK